MKSLLSTKRYQKAVVTIITRKVCFDVALGSTLFHLKESNPLLVNSLGARVSRSWTKDDMHAGSSVRVQVSNMMHEFFVLARTTNHAVIVQDIHTKQILTVKAANLSGGLVKKSNAKARAAAASTLLQLFDADQVLDVTIRFPHEEMGPVVFDAVRDNVKVDDQHPYVIIQYKKQPFCLGFQCTSEVWAPHITPMKILVADRASCGEYALWNKEMALVTCIDLSRMGTFPQKCLVDQFRTPRSSAKENKVILDTIMQVVLCHAKLNGDQSSSFDEDLKTEEEELEEEEVESTLVIGRYEVDKATLLPVDPELVPAGPT